MSRKFTDEEKNINKNKIFIKNSPYYNKNELVKYHLITKHELLEYKCYSDKCPTKKGNWKRKIMYLILERKNNKADDLRITNLRLICPNCFCQDKGPNYFNEFKKTIERKCRYCNYLLNNKYNNDTCLICTKKLREIDISLTSNEYADLINTTFDTSGNVSVAYHNEYTSIIENKHDSIPSNTNFNSKTNNIKLKYPAHLNKLKNKTSTSSSLTCTLNNKSIKLNIDTLSSELLNKLDNI
jgi:hypothetical protein